MREESPLIRESRPPWIALLIIVGAFAGVAVAVWLIATADDESPAIASSAAPSTTAASQATTAAAGFPAPDPAGELLGAVAIPQPSDRSWRLWCTQLRGPFEVSSKWRTSEIVLDGAATGNGEWGEAEGVFLGLEYAVGSPRRFDPCPLAMVAWFLNDETWLYGLYFVPYDEPPDQGDAGGFMLFRGQSCCGIDSDFGTIPYAPGAELGPWDAYGWDTHNQWLADVEASPPGTIDIEGMGSFDGSGYWFEWRKRLDSGDGRDWVLRPGQTVGNPAALTWFLANFWDSSQRASLERTIAMTLADAA